MPKTLLQMVQTAERELGLPQSSGVFTGNTDDTGVQMGALANRCLDELRQMNRWVALQFEYNLVCNPPIITTGDLAAGSAIITNIPSTAGIEANSWAVQSEGVLQAARVLSVDSSTQITMTMENVNTENVVGQAVTFAQDTFDMPDGFEWFNNRTMWDRTNRWELLGPDSPQIDQWHRSGIVATGPRRHFRELGPYGKKFRIWPPPVEITQPLQLVFEYLSINAVRVAGSSTVFAQYFENDTDTCLLNENAIIMGIKWMFWEIKGFGSYVTLQNRWVDYVDRLIARDGGAGTLSITKEPDPLLISPNNVQDGFFPGPTGPNMN